MSTKLKKTNTRVSVSKNDLPNIAEDILKKCKQKGATEAEIGIEKGKALSVDVRMGNVDKVEHHQENALWLTTYIGKCKGNVSVNNFSQASLDAAIDKALAIAKFSEEDEYAGLAASELLAKEIPELDLYHPHNLTVEDAVAMATDAEQAGFAADKKITNSEGAGFAGGESYKLYANTNGFLGDWDSTSYSMSCCLLASLKDEMQRDYDYTVSREFNKLVRAKEIGELAAQKAVSRLGSRSVKTQSVPVLFEAKVATGLIGSFISAISGGNLYRKTTFLLDALNKEVFPNFININELPHIPKALGSTPFDADGLPTRENKFVVDGVLNSYSLGLYSSRKLNMSPTGNGGGVHNLRVNAGKNTSSKEEILSQMGTGLIVTSTMGHGVNILTGDYSQGASGFWVENGKVAFPVHEITIAGNLKDMYSNIVCIGDDVETRTNINVGSILLEQMTVAGG